MGRQVPMENLVLANFSRHGGNSSSGRVSTTLCSPVSSNDDVPPEPKAHGWSPAAYITGWDATLAQWTIVGIGAGVSSFGA